MPLAPSHKHSAFPKGASRVARIARGAELVAQYRMVERTPLQIFVVNIERSRMALSAFHEDLTLKKCRIEWLLLVAF